MGSARSVWSFVGPAITIVAIATMSGLALHAVMFEASVHEIHVATLEARLTMLEGELADQAAEIDALKKKPERPTRPPRAGRPDPAATYAVPVGDAPVKGPAGAPITLIEYMDFQCPFCARVQPTIARLQSHYGDNLRVVFKHHPLPFHRRAEAAAIAADCAGEQGHFFEMEARLWDNQRQLSDEELLGYAGAIGGLRIPAWQRCFDKGDADGSIKQVVDEAKRFGANGTPGFFVNGRFLSGARPYENFTALIDEELARVRNSDVRPARYYDEVVMGTGKRRVE